MVEAKTTKAKKVAPKAAVQVKTLAELQAELIQLKADLLQAKLGNAAGELTNPHRITVLRKNIARTHSAIWSAQAKADKEKE